MIQRNWRGHRERVKFWAAVKAHRSWKQVLARSVGTMQFSRKATRAVKKRRALEESIATRGREAKLKKAGMASSTDQWGNVVDSEEELDVDSAGADAEPAQDESVELRLEEAAILAELAGAWSRRRSRYLATFVSDNAACRLRRARRGGGGEGGAHANNWLLGEAKEVCDVGVLRPEQLFALRLLLRLHCMPERVLLQLLWRLWQPVVLLGGCVDGVSPSCSFASPERCDACADSACRCALRCYCCWCWQAAACVITPYAA